MIITRADEHYNSIFVKELSQELTLELFKKYSWKNICALLQQKMPLKSCNIHLYVPGKLVITLHAPSLEALIKFLPQGAEGVLTHQRIIESTAFFDPNYLARLPLIFLADPLYSIGQPATALFSFFNQVPKSVRARYEIIWLNKTEIILKRRQEPIQIIVNHTTHFNPALHKKIEYCVDLVQAKKLSNKKRLSSWDIDMRFQNQCIISSSKGGKDYEFKTNN